MFLSPQCFILFTAQAWNTSWRRRTWTSKNWRRWSRWSRRSSQRCRQVFLIDSPKENNSVTELENYVGDGQLFCFILSIISMWLLMLISLLKTNLVNISSISCNSLLFRDGFDYSYMHSYGYDNGFWLWLWLCSRLSVLVSVWLWFCKNEPDHVVEHFIKLGNLLF